MSNIFINDNYIISALKGFNPKSATFRQHYYPEGGWGWVICLCAILVQIFTSGIQLSFGIFYIHWTTQSKPPLKLFDPENYMTTGFDNFSKVNPSLQKYF